MEKFRLLVLRDIRTLERFEKTPCPSSRPPCRSFCTGDGEVVSFRYDEDSPRTIISLSLPRHAAHTRKAAVRVFGSPGPADGVAYVSSQWGLQRCVRLESAPNGGSRVGHLSEFVLPHRRRATPVTGCCQVQPVLVQLVRACDALKLEHTKSRT